MKKIILLIIVLILLSGCGNGILTPVELDAEFTITYWEIGYFGDAEVYYTIKNTGNVTIDYYEVYFKGKCSDGSIYQDFDNGLNVKVGETLSDFTYIFVPPGKDIISVYVTDYNLTNYNYLWSF
ncbi:hypothetical protein ES708_09303 [subsurface metagenome]